MRSAWRAATLAATLLLVAGALSPAAGQQAAATSTGDGSWPVTTGDRGSQRYSPLDQIDADNASTLEVAWRWVSPDGALADAERKLQSARMQPGSNQVTPLKIGSRLYVTTGLGQVAAIDVMTGETAWVHNPEAYSHGRPTNLGFTHRGATYWSDGETERLFYASGDAHLRALDPATGEPIASFGDGGSIDLTQGLRRPIPRRSYTVSSPVVVCRDVVVSGSSISDGPTQPKAPPGDIRGFDVRTGEVKWTFHSVPQPGEVGYESWEDDSWAFSGNTNVWTLMSVDEELGLVYLPFGTPTNDWYGGHRLGDNLFAESLVAIDCETGERRWHFQAIHHGLWDYDLVTSPILGDFTVDGSTVKAAMQLSKQGFVYVFDRATGEPVWPIEERAVPQSKVPGERTAPTQPFPTRPPPFDRQGMTYDDLVAFTPEIHDAAKKILDQYDYGPLFTPPSTRGTVNMPGWAGGASWPGGAFDPETGFLYVPSYTNAVVMTLKEPDRSRSGFDYIGSIQVSLPGPAGLPLTKPPYTRLTAYDMNRGEIAWVVPLGDGPINHPAIRDLDLPPLGSGARGTILATKTLLFVTLGESVYGAEARQSVDLAFDSIDEIASDLGLEGAQTVDASDQEWRHEPSLLLVLDKKTGETIHRMELDANADGSPMTYMHEGVQYLTFAVGGAGTPAEFITLRAKPSG